MTHPFVATARQQIGKPFRHRGRGPRYFDCAGLLAYCVTQNGGAVQDMRAYSPEPYDDTLRTMMRANCGEPVSDMQAGDFLLIKFVDRPHHVAIASDYKYGGFAMIHADGAVGRVVEHRIDGLWQPRIMEVYRYGA